MILAQKTDRTRSSYWLVQPGSIHESLVQLSLGDTVEKYHAWLPPVLSLSRSHPARYGSAKKRERPCASLIFLVKSSFGSLKTKEMDQKKGGLLQRAMPPKPTEGSRIRPIASTYNVMITLVYPFSLVVQRTVAPPTRKGINMETSLPFGSENLWRKSGFKFPETTRLYSQREYAAPKIIPSAANVATKLFLWKAPTEMGNSPIKLLVPGELILAKVEEKEMVGRFGMVLTEPP